MPLAHLIEIEPQKEKTVVDGREEVVNGTFAIGGIDSDILQNKTRRVSRMHRSLRGSSPCKSAHPSSLIVAVALHIERIPSMGFCRFGKQRVGIYRLQPHMTAQSVQVVECLAAHGSQRQHQTERKKQSSHHHCQCVAAWRISSAIASGDSSPIDTRITPSVTPR